MGTWVTPIRSRCRTSKRKSSNTQTPLRRLVGKLTREEAMFQNVKAPKGGMNTLARGAAFEHPDVTDETYADGRVAAETIRRLRAAKDRSQPFLIVAGFARPHLPFSAPKKYWDLHDAAGFELASNRDLPIGSPKVAQNAVVKFATTSPFPTRTRRR